MGQSEFPKTNRLALIKNFVIFNLAAVIGFILGTSAFIGSMIASDNPTFAFLFSNCIGGLSHFGANYIMQRQKKEKIVKNFVVFNATGIAGFLVSSVMFALTLIYTNNSTVAWLSGSLFGTVSHWLLNEKAMKLNLKRQTPL